MKGLSRGAARRYARALIDVAGPAGASDVKTALGQAAAVVAQNAALREALSHPALAAERKKGLLKAVFKDTPDVFVRLLELLVDRGRLGLLELIHQEFVALYNASHGIVVARAVSAQPLDAGQKDALGAALRAVTGKQVEIEASLEPAVLGGLRIEMEGRVYDGSVRARLAALKERLRGSAVTS